MALFGFGKKKEDEKKGPTCACHSCCSSSEEINEINSGYPESTDGICSLKVLGAGCKSCHQQYEEAKKAIKKMGLPVEVEYITDLQKVMSYGTMSMPALVLNEKVVAMGKVLNAAEVEKLLHQLGY